MDRISYRYGQPGGRISGHFILVQLMFIGTIATILALSTTSNASPFPGQAGIRAELLHRQHPDHFSQVEKVRHNVESSTARARSISERRLIGGSPDNVSTVVTTVTDIPFEYYMNISLGTPPQSFVAIADTGSDLVWLRCAPCADCLNKSAPVPVFDPYVSTTYSELSCSSPGCEAGAPYLLQGTNTTACDYHQPSCPYAYGYGDQTVTVGNFSSETVTLTTLSGQDLKVPDFWFGCSTKVSSSTVEKDAAGLIGLGQGAISFTSQLGQNLEDKFSYCLVNVSATQSSPLLFGHDSATAAMVGELQYTTILSNPASPTYYYVGLDGITVDGVAVDFNFSDIAITSDGSKGTILDSGTSFTSLFPEVWDAVTTVIIEKTSTDLEIVNATATTGLDLCYNVSSNPDYPTSSLPGISFKFAGSTSGWDLSFENQWVEADVNTLCLAISRGAFSTYSTNGINIIGNYQQQDFFVEYDRVKGRIGFAQTACGSLAAGQ